MGTKGSLHNTDEGYLSRERLLWWSGRSVGAKERIRELGYTGVVVELERLEEWNGVDVPIWVHILSPDLSPASEEFPGLVWEKLDAVPEDVAGILWESVYRPWEEEREHTQYDLIHRELKVVEAAMEGRHLLFYPSAQEVAIVERQVAWLEDLRIDAAAGTSLAFSAVAGFPTDEHREYHPFLAAVANDPGSTPLFPIVNAGCVGHGESLWPTYVADTLASVWPYMRGDGVGGVIALTPSVPRAGCTLDANLFLTSEVTSRDGHPEPLLADWFERNGLDSRRELPIANRLRSVQRSLQQLLHLQSDQDILSAEPQRIRVQSVLAQLEELKLETDESANGIRSQLPYFIRDAKRLLYQYMQANNISLPNVFAGDDMQDSFWTTMAGNSGKGISFGTDSSFLHEPQRGESESRMNSIYQTTYAVS